jgi:hypothetical protein
VRENVIDLLVKMKLFVCKQSHIPDAVHVYDRRYTQFAIKTMTVCFAAKANDSSVVDISFM